MEERRAVGINDIEQLILLGDKVLDEAMMSLFRYDNKGVPLTSSEKRRDQMEQDSADGTAELIWHTVKGEYDSFYDILALTAEDLEKKLRP